MTSQQPPKNPTLAAILSFLIAGVGQIYNGEVVKGIVIIVVQIVNVLLMGLVIGFITWPVVWIWSIYDAYKVAKRINDETAQQVVETTKVCPRCAERVNSGALVCHFCSYQFVPDATPLGATPASQPVLPAPAPVQTPPATPVAAAALPAQPAPAATGIKYCPQCGAQAVATANFCLQCGGRFETLPAPAAAPVAVAEALPTQMPPEQGASEPGASDQPDAWDELDTLLESVLEPVALPSDDAPSQLAPAVEGAGDSAAPEKPL
jgi:TM2 domain-containing membrane protein YozV